MLVVWQRVLWVRSPAPNLREVFASGLVIRPPEYESEGAGVGKGAGCGAGDGESELPDLPDEVVKLLSWGDAKDSAGGVVHASMVIRTNTTVLEDVFLLEDMFRVAWDVEAGALVPEEPTHCQPIQDWHRWTFQVLNAAPNSDVLQWEVACSPTIAIVTTNLRRTYGRVNLITYQPYTDGTLLPSLVPDIGMVWGALNALWEDVGVAPPSGITQYVVDVRCRVTATVFLTISGDLDLGDMIRAASVYFPVRFLKIHTHGQYVLEDDCGRSVAFRGMDIVDLAPFATAADLQDSGVWHDRTMGNAGDPRNGIQLQRGTAVPVLRCGSTEAVRVQVTLTGTMVVTAQGSQRDCRLHTQCRHFWEPVGINPFV
jgi:hypothetical protein